MSGKSRLNPRPIIEGHLATLRDPNTGLRLRDITEQFLLPLAVGAAAAVVEINVSRTTAAAILTLAGIFAAFFFQLSVQLLDRAAAWAEGDPQPGPETTRYALLLEDLSASTTYAALIAAGAATAALAVGISKAGWPERLLAGIAVAMLVHLATTLFLVATRVFLLRARADRWPSTGRRVARSGLRVDPTNDDQVEVLVIMRALEPEVLDAMWAAAEPLLPAGGGDHPLGCHRPRISDRLCFEGIVIRLVTGCSWVTAERLLGNKVSDTTLRARRDEWIEAGVFDALVAEALGAYDRIVGLDLSDTAVDGSIHKAPCGGDGTGKSPVDRAKLGWKWSLLCDRSGIPVAWAADGANRNDVVLFEPTVAAAGALAAEVETLHLDRGYDCGPVNGAAAAHGIDDIVCARKRPRGAAASKTTAPLGMRWAIERTNSWLSNFGQMRRNTDRKPPHRLAQLALAIALILTVKLIKWRDRWSPT